MKNIGKVGFSRPKDFGTTSTKSRLLIKNLVENEGFIPKENAAQHNIPLVKKDIQYVKSLSNFESRFLPDINMVKEK